MSDRATRVLLAAVAGLLLLAAVSAVLSVTRGGPEYAEGSPEATVQAYLVAAVAKDGEEAVRHLDPASGCTPGHIEQGYAGRDVRVVLRDTTVKGDRATVRVDVVNRSGGPFASEWSSERTFDLRRADGGWRITGSPWPAYCEREVRSP